MTNQKTTPAPAPNPAPAQSPYGPTNTGVGHEKSQTPPVKIR